MALIVILWLAEAGLCSFIASQKGRASLDWFISGLLFGIFTLVAVIAVPNLEDKK